MKSFFGCFFLNESAANERKMNRKYYWAQSWQSVGSGGSWVWTRLDQPLTGIKFDKPDPTIFESGKICSESDPISIFWKQIRPDFPTGKYDFMSELKDISYYI